MKLCFHGERVLAVVAHPDDAELLCAGTLARARDDGAAIGTCVLCRGDKGQPSTPVDDLATVRRNEMQQATELLGGELLSADFPDGTLADDATSRPVVVDLYRRFRPTLILAHGPQDYHPDHRAASAIAEAASWLGASRGYQTQWEPLSAPPALWWMDTIGMSGFEPGFSIDVSDYLELKQSMLACHQSQIERGRDADFSPLQDLMHRQCRTRGAQAETQAAEAFRTHTAFKRLRAW